MANTIPSEHCEPQNVVSEQQQTGYIGPIPLLVYVVSQLTR